MCNFKIGQEVVCVKSHSHGVVKEGNHYVIKAVKTQSCACGNVVVDVGIPDDLNNVGKLAHCLVCGGFDGVIDGIWWLHHNRFAPLQTDSEEADMKAALEEVFERELFEV